MNCKDFDELAGAYVIGALTPQERARADAHIRSCDKHPDFAELRSIVEGLALASPEMDPPARLKARLMNAVRAEVAAPSSAPGLPRRSLLEVISGWISSPRLGYGLAGVMAVVVAALLIWNISLQGNGSNQLVVQMSGQASGQLIYLKDEKVGVMQLQGLQALPSGKLYEVWGISGGNATALGTFTPNDGTLNAAISFDRTGVQTVAITVEEAPGVDQPTSQPIISGNF